MYLINKGLYSEAKKSFVYIAKKKGKEFIFDKEYFAEEDRASFNKLNT